jgi:hypothetical protein
VLDFRKFRKAYKDNHKSYLEELQCLLKKQNFNQAFKYFLYISEQINCQSRSFPKEIPALTDEFSERIPTKAKSFISTARKVIIISRTSSQDCENIALSIDRSHYDPVVILLGKNTEEKTLKKKLSQFHIPCRLEETYTEISLQVSALQNIIEEERAHFIINLANDADLDLKIISKAYPQKVISCHFSNPIKSTKNITLSHFIPSFWNLNEAIPSFRKLAIFDCRKYDQIPNEVIEYSQQSGEVCLITQKPLELFSHLTEEVIQKFSFCSTPLEIEALMRNCREIIALAPNLEDSIKLARQYGCDFKNLTTNRKWLYESLTQKFNATRKFKINFNKMTGKKSTQRKKLPRLLLFRNDHSAPIINNISTDIYSALINLGVDVLQIDLAPLHQASLQEDFKKLSTIRTTILNKIKVFQPDQALGYNAFGIFPSGDSHLLEKLGIPYNGLFFDNPFYSKTIINNCPNKDMVRIFTLDQILIPLLKEAGFKNTHYFPIATSAQRFHAKSSGKFPTEKLLFTATVKPQKSQAEIADLFPQKEHQEFINFAYPKIIQGQTNLHNLLNKFHNFQGNTEYPKDLMSFFKVWFAIDNQATSKLRLELVNRLKGFDLDIYGGDNWEKYQLSQKHSYKGYMSYNNLPEAARAASLTLCCTPVNIINGIQQRILDCGAMGAGILSDYRPVLEEHFKLDEELYVYQSFDELEDKVDFLLKTPKAKEKATKMLYKKVMKDHTWETRMSQFLNLI